MDCVACFNVYNDESIRGAVPGTVLGGAKRGRRSWGSVLKLIRSSEFKKGRSTSRFLYRFRQCKAISSKSIDARSEVYLVRVLKDSIINCIKHKISRIGSSQLFGNYSKSNRSYKFRSESWEESDDHVTRLHGCRTAHFPRVFVHA